MGLQYHSHQMVNARRSLPVAQAFVPVPQPPRGVRTNAWRRSRPRSFSFAFCTARLPHAVCVPLEFRPIYQHLSGWAGRPMRKT